MALQAVHLAVVADDDDDARALVANAARSLGLHVIETADGAELIACVRDVWARHERVEIVISDVGMPECDGIEATLQLLASEPSLPIVLMTAFGDQTTIKRAKQAGARRVLRKPFSLSVLEEVLTDLRTSG